MVTFVRRHKISVSVALVALATAGYFIVQNINRDPLSGLVTAKVERGTVESFGFRYH